jgi:H+/Cl- antiporter ClcA
VKKKKTVHSSSNGKETDVWSGFLAHKGSKWFLFILISGAAAGTLSALFLYLLDRVTEMRMASPVLICFLPLAGFVSGWIYYRFGGRANAGNGVIISEFYAPSEPIPFRLAPLVLAGTLVTHLFGGSAGREGTAVQMSVAVTDRFVNWFGLKSLDRQIMIRAGISAGFASVFGTPFAGAIFAMEALTVKKFSFRALIPVVVIAFWADFVCHAWGVEHTRYEPVGLPPFQFSFLGWIPLAAIIMGLTAFLFLRLHHSFARYFQQWITYPPLRPLTGGAILAPAVFLFGWSDYVGLGVPVIVSSFSEEWPVYAFLLKIMLTTFTLAAGFKGGEVTPLFFVGALLGNALSTFIPLPRAFLVGLGFVSVFSGATNAPLACAVMGMELFGWQMGVYLLLSAYISFLFSGVHSLYGHAENKNPLYSSYRRIKRIMKWN